MRLFKLGMILVATLFLAGCWSYREPDDTAWVMAVGLDRGRENDLTVSLQIAVPANISGGEAGGGGGGMKDAVEVISVEVATLQEGLELSRAWVDRRVDLSHTKFVVFGRALAEEDVGSFLGVLTRFREFRPTVKVAVANGRAEDLLRAAKPLLESSPAKYWELLAEGWAASEFIPLDGLRRLNIDAKSPGGAPGAILVAVAREKKNGTPDGGVKEEDLLIAGTIPRRGGPEVDIMGYAIFDKGRMIGVLNAGESTIRKAIRGTFRSSLRSVDDPLNPDKLIVLQVVPREPPQVDIRIGEDGLPRVAVMIPLEGDIQSIESGENYERPERLALVEQAVEEAFQRDARAALDKAQSEFGVDIFSLGFRAKRLFPTWQAWDDFNWDEKFPEAEISIEIDFKVRRVGLIRETVPLR